MKFSLLFFIYLLLVSSLLNAEESSYYDSEPCSKYRANDYPVKILPWETNENKSHCNWSISNIQHLIELSKSSLTHTLETAVSKDINDYAKLQQGVAATLECCIDIDFAQKTKTNTPVCAKNKTIKSFCEGSGKGDGFKDYLKDLNARLTALRIATFRNSEHASFSKKILSRPIETPIPLLLSATANLSTDIISLSRMPRSLAPLTQHEQELTMTLLGTDAEARAQSQFIYKNFVTNNPEKDYYTLLGATPFLGEISKSEITQNDFKNILIAYRERNKNQDKDFKSIYYRDFMSLVSEKIKTIEKSGSLSRSQSLLCKQAEFKMKLAKLGIIVEKQTPLLVATVIGALRGARLSPKGTTIPEIAKNISVSVGTFSAPALAVVAGVDLARSKTLDSYCDRKLSDENTEEVVPICNQAAVLRTLDSAQSNLLSSAAFTGGFMAFRYRKAVGTFLQKGMQSLTSTTTSQEP